MFDGLSATQGIPIEAAGWLSLKPGRRLRVIGTAYTEVAANQIKNNLGTNPNVFVHPGDPEYWYTNKDYHRSLQRLSDAQPPTFRTPDVPFTLAFLGDPSSLTSIFISKQSRDVSADKTSVAAILVLIDETKKTKVTITETAHQEAAALAMLDPGIHQRLIPVGNTNDFKLVTGRLQETTENKSEPKTSHRHRHAWSMFGGLFNHKGRAFVGYFQLCLEESGF